MKMEELSLFMMYAIGKIRKEVRKMTRHIKLLINLDLTTWSESMEDFEIDTAESIREQINNYLYESPEDIISNTTIKKIWFEED